MSEISKITPTAPLHDVVAVKKSSENKGMSTKSQAELARSDRAEVSEEAVEKKKKALTEQELLDKIDFEDSSEENLALFKELVNLRMKNGFYSRSKPAAAKKSALDIARQMAGRSLQKGK